LGLLLKVIRLWKKLMSLHIGGGGEYGVSHKMTPGSKFSQKSVTY
jgi:hypothetical protein